MVLQTDVGGVRSVSPVEHNLLVRGTTLAEHRMIVAMVKIPPQTSQTRWYLESLEYSSSHTQMMKLGEGFKKNIINEICHGRCLPTNPSFNQLTIYFQSFKI